MGNVRGVCWRETTGLPYDVRRYITRIHGDVLIAEHHTPRREISTCAYATMSDRVVREVSENLFHLSPFREGDGAAMCRRPPRGWLDIVGAKLLWGVPDGGFLVPSFSQKSGIVHDG